MVEPPMPPGPVEDGEDDKNATGSGEDMDRREEAAVAPGDPVPDDEDPKTR